MFHTVDSCHKCNWQNQKLNPVDNHLCQGPPREKPETKQGVYLPASLEHTLGNELYIWVYSSGPVKNMHIYFGRWVQFYGLNSFILGPHLIGVGPVSKVAVNAAVV
jgi:hypothetical protein